MARDANLDTIQNSTLPLASDNIYSEIQRDILPTVVVSSFMAQDTFVRDWALNGEQDQKLITRYLKSIQDKYDMETAYFISDKTLRYYHSTMVLRSVSPDSPDDEWYFRAKDIAEEFEINLDEDFLTAQNRNFFVNHKMLDYQGQFLGIIGVGLSTNTISSLIKSYQNKFNRRVFFVNNQGEVVMHGADFEGQLNLSRRQGYEQHAENIINRDVMNLTYHAAGIKVLVTTRFIPELDWYLIVEEKEVSQQKILNSLYINLFFSFLISLVVLLVARFVLSRYQNRLEIMANTDSLTHLYNRHAFESEVLLAKEQADKSLHDLCLLLVDIDYFKKINDQYGHLSGDAVLKQFAALLKKSTPTESVTCRWGGEEFIVILPKTAESEAKELALSLLETVEAHTFRLRKNRTVKLTMSCGLSQLLQGDDIEDLLKRTDKALYSAKKSGRNQLVTI